MRKREKTRLRLPIFLLGVCKTKTEPAKRIRSDLGVLGLDGTADKTGAAGGDETDLLTGGGEAGAGGGLADVLVVTTTVRVVDGVHSHTTGARPRVALDLELVVGTAGLEQGLVDTATAGDDANGGTRGGGDGLLGARGETDARGLAVGVVADDGGVVARGAGERATVTGLLLDVADNGTFGERREGENVGDVQGSLLTAVDELAGGEALGGNEGLDTGAVLVGVTEGNLGEGSTTVGEQGTRAESVCCC
ncbi:hypothetical protein L1887_51398 [Cichorium endivia]|nr:hypothetical protein L1887_51398 [Cichorium endivia]